MVDFSDQPIQADVIVILASPYYFNSNVNLLDQNTYSRVDKSIALHKAGYSEKFLIIGGLRIEAANLSVGELIKEKLILYGIPEKKIYVHDELPGAWNYFDNIVSAISKYQEKIDFDKVIFVTSAENTFRIRKVLAKVLGRNPVVVASNTYQYDGDWAQRFEVLRELMNELLVAIPLFYFTNRI